MVFPSVILDCFPLKNNASSVSAINVELVELVLLLDGFPFSLASTKTVTRYLLSNGLNRF
jgi:hypothetical protein